ncbi:RsmB/NOP family class I SAM-dependent RNA methyltransferase [Vallitalea okinawensis]|uniref:RsmB/NOP family class I SAM-dependent RNA methyltransferase n=1 Tax=Vallitalea okinawensis TaxID=2078660 RepID=UPI002E8E0013|nr:RsmB/NOP family class I SAM-dependent RNA methyltransferase [Vallitalea okinawensis]
MLPESYKEKMQELLGKEYEAYLDSFHQERYYGLRINTLKWSPMDFNRELFECEPIPWCDEGLYYKKGYQPAKDPYYHAGLYYIQEPSAMSPAAILDVKPGDRVLDLCAAPGGKSTHLGSKLQGEGILVSNDISVSRTRALVKNIELAGIRNAIVTSEEPKKLVKAFEGYFDKILVDAPCSGEGMFRKEPGLIKSWEEFGVEHFAEIQRSILLQAAKMLKPGGQLLYSTCTFDPSENEGTIKAFLEEHPEFCLIPIHKSGGIDDGQPEWVNGPDELSYAARLWPHKIKGEGHFIAHMVKENAELKNNQISNNIKISHKELKDFYDFYETYMEAKVPNELKVINDKVYRLPYDLPSLKGIRTLRQGWLLGELKKNRFEPSQAFAMGLRMEDVKLSVNMCRDDHRVIRYLKGETIEVSGEDGWVLVGVDGFPLGWGKRIKGRVKNKYAKSWRWQ